MQDFPERGGAPPSRRLKLVLAVSLALNLLVAGAFGGAYVMHGRWGGGHPPRPDMVAGPLTRALAPEDRRAIAVQMRHAYRDDPARRDAMRADFEGLIADLEARPFDRAALAGRLARHRVHFSDRLALGQEALLDRLAAMSDEARAAYADRLRQGLERRRHHWRHAE